MKVKIRLSGCDDTNELFAYVTNEEFAFLQWLSEETVMASEDVRQPFMQVFAATEDMVGLSVVVPDAA